MKCITAQHEGRFWISNKKQYIIRLRPIEIFEAIILINLPVEKNGCIVHLGYIKHLQLCLTFFMCFIRFPHFLKLFTFFNTRLRMKRVSPCSDEEDDKAGLLDELYEEFICGVCCELMVLPTTLNCGHSFCRHCLAHWFKVGERAECPSCRQVSKR